jgi:TatD DNase family protein
MYHDTHVHLELLLQKLGHLPSERELDPYEGTFKPEIIELDESVLNNLLEHHEFVVQSTVSTDNFNFVYNLLNFSNKVYYLIGSHPEMVNKKFSVEKYLDAQRDLIVDYESSSDLNARVVGIGECGLDYYYTSDKDIWQKQAGLFEEQIRLAIKLKLPLVIHCRMAKDEVALAGAPDAFADLFEILEEYPEIHGHFLVHCFTGGVGERDRIIDMGGKIGVGGVVTYKSATNLQEAVASCPTRHLVLETDLPFLAPDTHRGNICMPEMILRVAQKVAELQKIDTAMIWKNSLENTENLFGIGRTL